jgi:hypothetical protein
LTFGTQTEASVYMYNTGTLAQWGTNPSVSGSSAGEYISVPKFYAGLLGLPVQIPSMQGLLVKAISNSSLATFGISYSSVVMTNTDQQRAPALNTTDKTCTVIEVAGAHFSDKMWLFTQAGCSHNFDNGWDGTKLKGSALVPQIFATEQDGNYQVDAVGDMNNTDLAFQAGEDTEYTMTFSHTNLDKMYSAVYLTDYVEKKTVDITASGSTYSFTAKSTAQPVKRFKIVTRNNADTGSDANSYLKIFSSGKTAFINNFSNLSGECSLYDIAGHFILKTTFSPNGITAISENLLPGVYILKAETTKEKLAKQIILF